MSTQNNNIIDNIVRKTPISGLFIIKKPIYKDERGNFRELVRVSELKEATGVDFKFKQWSFSNSKPKVIRALHSEDQNKIIFPVNGELFAAYVDVREDSKTFGKVFTHTFDGVDNEAIFIPKGVANSICVTGNKPVNYMYLIDEYYDPKKTKGIAWDDPDLAIDWPVKDPIISERDRNNPTLREVFPKMFR
ncbi:dTDP-4-dehydrorhamnose 3,5-epimerase family protein [Patescibacteria group bacterium]